MKKIVITGATGFIGVYLIREWLKRDVDIYAIIRPGSKNAGRIPMHPRIHVVEMNMGEYDRLPNRIESCDYFYHLAWEGARLPYRDSIEIQRNNYDCTLKAFDAAIKLGCSFFLGAGSQAEYGQTEGVADENYPCRPQTEYGKQKLNAFKELSQRALKHLIKFIWIRIFSVYGPYDDPGTLIMQAVQKMRKNESVEMTAGTQLWDYLYVADAAEAMVMFAENQCNSGVYNMASGEYKMLREFIENIKMITESNSELRFGAVPYGAEGPVNLIPDVSKIKTQLGWKNGTTFEEGIHEMIAGCKFGME